MKIIKIPAIKKKYHQQGFFYTSITHIYITANNQEEKGI
jgi:hypothetical protein